MKKIYFMLAVVLVSTGCFAQKANVSKAKNKALATESPDFEGARAAINEALKDPTTKDQANTWYVAGLIGYQENSYLTAMEAFGQAADDEKKGKAVEEAYEYFIKAYDLAQIPNEKGKIDAKTAKSAQQKMFDFYNAQDLVKYGIYLNGLRDFSGAYKAFNMHLSIQELPMMQEEKYLNKMPKDTIYDQYKFYMGLFASQAEMHQEAIKTFTEMSDGEYEAISVNEFLFQELQTVGDTATSIQLLEKCITRFPQEPFFLQSMINYYIFGGKEDIAVKYLDEAIEREPNESQYYRIRGNLADRRGDFDAAVKDYEKALELTPESDEAQAGMGYIIVDIANKQKEDADAITNQREYDKQMLEVNKTFAKAIPYFEKAHELKPENTQYMMMLKQLYYRLKMNDKYEAINAELNAL